MTLRVRPVNLARDRSILLELLGRNLEFVDHAARFDWLYYDNPAGRAWSWFVCDVSEDEPVGVASLFPRFFWIDGRIERCGEVGDFAVDAAYRSLGPALKLQRATFGPVDDGHLKFCYDCPPHEQGMAPFHRLGLTPVRQTTRHRCLLKSDEIVRRRIARGRAPLVAVLDFLLGVRRRLRGRASDLVLESHQGPFDGDFDALDRHLAGGSNVVRARRMAEDLNWRYRSNPVVRYQSVTARRGDELMGFAVFSDSDDGARVDDLVARSDGARVELMLRVVETAHAHGKAFVDAWLVSQSPESALAERAGFVRREPAHRFVVYPPQDGGRAPAEWRF